MDLLLSKLYLTDKKEKLVKLYEEYLNKTKVEVLDILSYLNLTITETNELFNKIYKIFYIKLSNKEVYFNFYKEIYLIIINTYPNKKEVFINYLYKIKKISINKIKKITNIKKKSIKAILTNNGNLDLLKIELKIEDYKFNESLLNNNDIKLTHSILKFIVLPSSIVISGIVIFFVILILVLGILGPYFDNCHLPFGRSYFSNNDVFKVERNYNNYFFNESTTLLASNNIETNKDYNLIIHNNLDDDEEGDEVIYLSFTNLNGELVNDVDASRVHIVNNDYIYYGEALYNDINYNYFIITNDEIESITLTFTNSYETLSTSFKLSSFDKEW